MLDEFLIRKFAARGTQNEDCISSGFRNKNFFRNPILSVAIFDLREKCSYYIYNTMLDVFPGVENIGIESKSKSPCWSNSEI